ncbi:MAG: DUF2306 domain-containing protein [Vicinamibacterales bacterium]
MTGGKFVWGTVLVLALIVSGYALAVALIPGLRPPFVQALFSEKALRAFGHLAAGGIALATGAVQFSTRLRVARPAVHRLLGTIYIVTVLISGLSALLLAPVSTGGLAAHFGFGGLAVLWVASAVIAYVRARDGEYGSHREWMIRSYALCLAAVTLRIYLPVSLAAGVPFEEAYPAIAWLCWVPNLVVAEWLLVRGPVARLDAVA